MHFYKYQGLGNHFVLLDHRGKDKTLLKPELAVQLCKPHRGIGADGVLIVTDSPDGYVRMHVQNADGSDAGMCGNGLRCVARFLDDCRVASKKGETSKIWVAERLYECEFTESGDISVEMGVARRESIELPSNAQSGEEIEIEALGRIFRGSCHFFGNPHYSIFVDDSEDPMHLAQEFGAALESHSAFSNRVNVSFSRKSPDGFETVVYERGVGITQACGSGACAAGASAVLRGHWQTEIPMVISLPGGELVITVSDDWRVQMQGEATRVFEGKLSVNL